MIDRSLADMSHVGNQLLLCPGQGIGIVNELILDLDHTGVFVGYRTESFLRQIKGASLAAVRTAVDDFHRDGVPVAAAIPLAPDPVVLAAAVAVVPEVGVAVAYCRDVFVLGDMILVVAASIWDICVVVRCFPSAGS